MEFVKDVSQLTSGNYVDCYTSVDASGLAGVLEDGSFCEEDYSDDREFALTNSDNNDFEMYRFEGYGVIVDFRDLETDEAKQVEREVKIPGELIGVRAPYAREGAIWVPPRIGFKAGSKLRIYNDNEKKTRLGIGRILSGLAAENQDALVLNDIKSRAYLQVF